MLASLSPSVFAHHLRRATDGFRLLADDPEDGLSVIEIALQRRGASRIPEKIALVRTGIFSEELLQALIAGSDDMPPQPALVIWQRLVELRLAVRLFDATVVAAFADHYLDLPRIRRYIDEETFENLFLAPSNLVDRYREAVVAIDVRTSADDISRGSGFLVYHHGTEAMVTCRHNVDPDAGLVIEQIRSAAGTPIETGPLLVSDSHDVALALVTKRGSGSLFRLSGDGIVFDTVYTLGFPMVPQAQSTLLGHRGEVNGSAQLFSVPGPTMIISNLVSPGSSGCPVLLGSGECAGMTIRWLEGQW